MGQLEIHDLAAAYALDALDPEDRWTYERHLDTCDRCRDDVTALREIGVELSYAVEGPPPPTDLRDRILAAARSEPRTATVVPIRSRRWAFPATVATAAAATCAAIGLGLWANSLRTQPPSGRVLALQGAQGHLILSGTRASLVLCLSDAPRGKTYEAWVIKDDRPRPAGLFEGGCRTVPLEEPVEPGATVAVTVEDDGGVEQPSGDVLASADV